MSAEVRLQARNPGRSCLVQAPAGAGKTELLTQRVLALLAIVDEPENILALTFTRKAAAEMRQRVLEALAAPEPDADASAHKRETWQLAQQAMRRCEEKGWHLLQHPARLQMMTLDSFTFSLARQLPLLSGLGQMPTPSEHVDVLYRQAAEAALNEAMRDYPAEAECVLLHQDHQTAATINLLADMLERREQWLQEVAAHARDMPALRRMIEQNLAAVITEQLRQCDALLPAASKQTLLPLMQFAGGNLGDESLQQISCWPEAELAQLSEWQRIADFLLLKGKPAFRSNVNKNQGFPAGKDMADFKTAMQAMLGELDEITELAGSLHALRLLPSAAEVDEGQWRVLESLFVLLILANTHLQQLFARRGEADFTEIALRAMAALGEHDAPGELLLRLDYRIHHILLDEFQDTSHLQLRLLQCLTAGWQAADGRARSLFMVGDPMQSIYRFRKADVGLFLAAADNALGLPPVEPLRLTRNFRSAPAIVQWVNRAFAAIFPASPDIVSGAVAHAPAQEALSHAGEVCLHLQHGRDANVEAAAVVALVQQELGKRSYRGDGQRIGILARSRKHLHAIMPALAEAGIAFRAINILPLCDRPEIRLLRALLRALLHLADRVSWAALLRAPCCGLDTTVLHALIAGDERPLWQLINDPLRQAMLDDDAQARLSFLIRALEPCVAAAGRSSVRHLLTTAWQRLGLPGMFDETAALNVRTALTLVESLEEGGRVDFALFDDRLEQLYAEPDASVEAARVELLTMHGAKGLQWDVVILPGLGCGSGKTDAPLLAFTETAVSEGAMPLLAVRAPTRASDALYDLVRRIEKEKDYHELQRLLYVACTRAETMLHMFGHVSESRGEAENSSLLKLLLEKDEQAFGATIRTIDAAADAQPARRSLVRMARIPDIPDAADPEQEGQEAEYVWAGVEAAPVGNAVHALLQQMAATGIEHWRGEDTQIAMVLMRRSLLRDGLSGTLLDAAMRRCTDALERILASERARWILSSAHDEAHQEWALSGMQQGRLVMHVIDRSFIDADVRWIIDYKTASHEGGELEQFLAEEERRHRAQLQRYAAAVHQLEPGRSIRTALYFPMLDAWREVSVNTEA